MGRYPEADLRKLQVGAIENRPTRVSVADFARPLAAGAARELIESLPDQLAARSIREAVERTAVAARSGRPVVAMCGGHVIKVGVSPCLIQLMERGVVSHLAMNGAAAIHDLEIAQQGRTSEDVEAHLHAGTFGMVDETGDFMNAAATEGRRREEGLGECWGRALAEAKPEHLGASLLANSRRVSADSDCVPTE